MSLKAFHVFFIAVSLVLSVAFGFWGVRDYTQTGNIVNLLMGIGGWILAVALVPYTVWFLKKLKKVSYL